MKEWKRERWEEEFEEEEGLGKWLEREKARELLLLKLCGEERVESIVEVVGFCFVCFYVSSMIEKEGLVFWG